MPFFIVSVSEDEMPEVPMYSSKLSLLGRFSMASSKASPSVSSFALSLPPAAEEEEENMEHCLLDEVAPILFFVTARARE